MFEGTQELAENKLLLLYIFNKIDDSISNTLITEIILENNLLNYFHLQQYLSELVSSGLLTVSKEGKKQIYTISSEGKNVLVYFENRIELAKKEAILTYLNKHYDFINKQINVSADYIPVNKTEYTVCLKLSENKTQLIEIKINVTSNSQAKDICEKWKNGSSEIYDKIISLLSNS